MMMKANIKNKVYVATQAFTSNDMSYKQQNF